MDIDLPLGVSFKLEHSHIALTGDPMTVPRARHVEDFGDTSDDPGVATSVCPSALIHARSPTSVPSDLPLAVSGDQYVEYRTLQQSWRCSSWLDVGHVSWICVVIVMRANIRRRFELHFLIIHNHAIIINFKYLVLRWHHNYCTVYAYNITLLF